MNTLSRTSPIASQSMAASSRRAARAAKSQFLSWHERLALAVGISEICLQFDSYLMYHTADAKLGAVGGINISVLSLCLVYLYGIWGARVMVTPQNQKPDLLFNLPTVSYTHLTLPTKA